jgi:hypothetical protein
VTGLFAVGPTQVRVKYESTFQNGYGDQSRSTSITQGYTLGTHSHKHTHMHAHTHKGTHK